MKPRTIALGVAVVVSAVVVSTGCGNDDASPRSAEARSSSTTVTDEAAASTEAPGETDDAESALALPTPPDGVSFRGSGDKTLPAIQVGSGGGVLRWRNAGEVFSLFDETTTVVDSVAGEGETKVPPGRHLIDVIAAGRWVFTVSNARLAAGA